MAFNDILVSEVMLANIPRALMFFISLALYYKAIDMFLTLVGERDLFKSGHLHFVQNLKEGLIIVHDRLKSIKLMNVAACQMLQLPFKESRPCQALTLLNSWHSSNLRGLSLTRRQHQIRQAKDKTPTESTAKCL